MDPLRCVGRRMAWMKTAPFSFFADHRSYILYTHAAQAISRFQAMAAATVKWISGHKDIKRNEAADKLAKQTRKARCFVGPDCKGGVLL